MTDHRCTTGHHTEPSYVCYSTHGCRCDGCTDAKVARNRYDRRKAAAVDTIAVELPAKPWRTVRRHLAARGVTPDEWLRDLATRADT